MIDLGRYGGSRIGGIVCVIEDERAPKGEVVRKYWTDQKVNLKKGSVDELGAKKTGRPANTPLDYVSDLQSDLKTLGYLKGTADGNYGQKTERAVKRFQRHAKRSFRMKGKVKVAASAWSGTANGVCDHKTALAVIHWIRSKFRIPIGVFKIVPITGGRLREDAAKIWEKAVADIKASGGRLRPDTKIGGLYYADTTRSLPFKHTGGNSKFSLHYSGRAIDLNWGLNGGGKNQRYWVVKETVSSKTFWRIFCKTDKQDGSQGEKISKESKKHYLFYGNKQSWIPEGYYIDVTKFLATRGFQRISAQSGWEKKEQKREWWHFYYDKDLQETFLDEMELIGYTEDQLKRWGFNEAELDRRPG